MNNHMNRKDIQERFADSAVAMFMEQYMTEIAEVADENAEDDSIEISEEFDRRGRKLIKKGLAKKQRQHAAKKLLQIGKVAVITFFILLGTFAILFTTVEAIRVPILNLLFKDEYLEISDSNESSASVANLLEEFVPAGYTLEACDIASTGDISIIYKDEQDNYIFYDEFSNMDISTLHLDVENAVTESITISGCDAVLINKHGYQLAWFNSDGNKLYQLESATLSREEIINIAEQIENKR